jgi:hypothetical protein
MLLALLLVPHKGIEISDDVRSTLHGLLICGWWTCRSGQILAYTLTWCNIADHHVHVVVTTLATICACFCSYARLNFL